MHILFSLHFFLMLILLTKHCSGDYYYESDFQQKKSGLVHTICRSLSIAGELIRTTYFVHKQSMSREVEFSRLPSKQSCSPSQTILQFGRTGLCFYLFSVGQRINDCGFMILKIKVNQEAGGKDLVTEREGERFRKCTAHVTGKGPPIPTYGASWG